MKKYEIKLNNEVYHVAVRELPADAEMATTQTNKPETEAKEDFQSKSQEVSENVDGIKIKAPMAGTILNVKVAPGQNVMQGDTLVVLEAMKMENEIVAPNDGVVGEIFVATNDRVESDHLLLTI